MDSDVFKLKPIGVVRNNVKEPIFGGWKDIVSNLEINDDFIGGLSGLEDYSHITVIYWLNLVGSCTLTHRPQGKHDVPEVGIFACRCPTRPNPLGISTAKLLGREKNSLSVKGLDALDGTPIIDIKPYTPQYDLYFDVIVPEWVNNLEY